MTKTWIWSRALGAAALAPLLLAALLLAALLLTIWAPGGPAADAEEKKVDVAALLDTFSAAWPTDRIDHRTPGEDSWKVYARTLRDAVAMGDAAALQDGLEHDNRQVRALCARALGYLGRPASTAPLTRALADDWATVRVLAADSLGEIGTSAARKALENARKTEEQGDVLLHIDVALRRESPPGKDYAKALLALQETDLAPAERGNPAPALTLETPAGRTVSLADYRGKKHVVLVFLYGDG